MPTPSFLVLYVTNPPASAVFYQQLLGSAPIDSSENFAMFSMGNGMMLGLWAKHDVQPAPAVAAGAAEIMFSAGSKDEVESMHSEWKSRGLPILQAPVQMDFGYTFTAQDPDGHRLRVSFAAM